MEDGGIVEKCAEDIIIAEALDKPFTTFYQRFPGINLASQIAYLCLLLDRAIL